MDQITQDIIELAGSKFLQLGIRNVSIDDICNELRISKKTFYKYFQQKEDLILSVLIDGGEKVQDKMQKIYQNHNAIDALILIIKEIRKSENSRSQIFMHDLEKYYPEVYKKFSEKKSCSIKESFQKNLQRGIEEGYYRADLDIEMTAAFHSLYMKTTFEEMLKTYPKISQKRVIDFFIDLIIRLITNNKGFEYIQNKLYKENNQE